MENNYHYNDYKKLAELYHNIYMNCMKYKEQKKLSDKEIDCGVYFNNFKFFSEKYIDDKNRKI